MVTDGSSGPHGISLSTTMDDDVFMDGTLREVEEKTPDSQDEASERSLAKVSPGSVRQEVSQAIIDKRGTLIILKEAEDRENVEGNVLNDIEGSGEVLVEHKQEEISDGTEDKNVTSKMQHAKLEIESHVINDIRAIDSPKKAMAFWITEEVKTTEAGSAAVVMTTEKFVTMTTDPTVAMLTEDVVALTREEVENLETKTVAMTADKVVTLTTENAVVLTTDEVLAMSTEDAISLTTDQGLTVMTGQDDAIMTKEDQDTRLKADIFTFKIQKMQPDVSQTSVTQIAVCETATLAVSTLGLVSSSQKVTSILSCMSLGVFDQLYSQSQFVDY